MNSAAFALPGPRGPSISLTPFEAPIPMYSPSGSGGISRSVKMESGGLCKKSRIRYTCYATTCLNNNMKRRQFKQAEERPISRRITERTNKREPIAQRSGDV
ncbi:unnamed protein product [Anisakis simplex]|uniref:Uncharacterized protein n=1 Tax=Anisakis simplex TaxID=6269 RepID=A0A0M3J5M1_ANISI|nr:unnamed protein product [Anisakis simplex]